MSFVDKLKSVVGVKKANGSNRAAEYFRPTGPDFLTRGVSDIAKMPTIPFMGFRFCYDLYQYSDLLRTIVRSITHETFRNGLAISKKFAVKCTICGAEYSTVVDHCEVCGSKKLREPNIKEYQYLKDWVKDVNFNDQSLLDVLRDVDTDVNIIDNAFIAVVKQYFYDEDGAVVGAKPLEVLRASPERIHFVMDRDGRFGRSDDGRVVLFCLEHRDKYKLVEEDKAEDARCDVCGKKLYPAYYRVLKSSGGKYLYYTNGEILHFKKFTSGIGYGLPPVFSVWQKVMILMKQDYFILTAYHLERPPKGLLILKGNRESIDKAWRRLQEESRINPHMIYPLIIEGGKDVRNVVEWLDLTLRSTDIDFIQFREEMRRTIGALWGVMPIFTGDTSSGFGLANEGLQILVTNRAVEIEQEIYNKKVLPWLMDQLGIQDWTIELIPNEGRDIVAKLQREQLRIQNAAAMAQLGYKPRAVIGEDGLDFDFIDETGAEIPNKLVSIRNRPISMRRFQRFEGEPIHQRPSSENQRFEGEETGIRQPKSQVVGTIGEGGAIEYQPEIQSGEASDLDVADFKKEDLLWVTYTDDEDFDVIKANWSKAVRHYGDARYAALDQAEFWKRYSGLSQRQAQKINGIILKAVLQKNYNREAIVNELVSKTSVDKDQADLIVRTELANIAQKAREIAYKDKTYVTKFRWDTARDQRVCEKCRKLAEMTKGGVTLDELKRLIKEVGGDSAREWLVHPGDRCRFIRVYGKKRYWEKGKAEKQIVPSERRVYITDPSKVPKGVKVFRGPKGGFYVDREELNEKRVAEAKVSEQCRTCKYYSGGLSCGVFYKGIPKVFREGELKCPYRKPREGESE